MVSFSIYLLHPVWLSYDMKGQRCWIYMPYLGQIFPFDLLSLILVVVKQRYRCFIENVLSWLKFIRYIYGKNMKEDITEFACSFSAMAIFGILALL